VPVPTLHVTSESVAATRWLRVLQTGTALLAKRRQDLEVATSVGEAKLRGFDRSEGPQSVLFVSVGSVVLKTTCPQGLPFSSVHQ